MKEETKRETESIANGDQSPHYPIAANNGALNGEAACRETHKLTAAWNQQTKMKMKMKMMKMKMKMKMMMKKKKKMMMMMLRHDSRIRT